MLDENEIYTNKYNDNWLSDGGSDEGEGPTDNDTLCVGVTFMCKENMRTLWGYIMSLIIWNIYEVDRPDTKGL